MKQKRDAKGRFAKMYPTREEYEAKIAKLSKECDSWKKSYEFEVEKGHQLKDIGDVLIQSMLWLYDRVPFWTKKKFKSYYEELIESNSNLEDVSEKMKKFV